MSKLELKNIALIKLQLIYVLNLSLMSSELATMGMLKKKQNNQYFKKPV